jgi:hypothetical protein
MDVGEVPAVDALEDGSRAMRQQHGSARPRRCRPGDRKTPRHENAAALKSHDTEKLPCMT